MVANVGGTNNLVSMISVAYQQSTSAGAQGVQEGAVPPPPPPAHGAGSDKLGMFDATDTDGSGSISESEYETLTQGILEVTGTELESDFSDYDLDGDGALNGAELKSVLDEAGFVPPPPPQGQVAAAYEAQSDEQTIPDIEDADLLSQLLEYLETQGDSDDVDITV